LDIFTNEYPELDGPDTMGRPNIEVTELSSLPTLGTAFPRRANMTVCTDSRTQSLFCRWGFVPDTLYPRQ
jgi:hypothetical protein